MAHEINQRFILWNVSTIYLRGFSQGLWFCFSVPLVCVRIYLRIRSFRGFEVSFAHPMETNIMKTIKLVFFYLGILFWLLKVLLNWTDYWTISREAMVETTVLHWLVTVWQSRSPALNYHSQILLYSSDNSKCSLLVLFISARRHLDLFSIIVWPSFNINTSQNNWNKFHYT